MQWKVEVFENIHYVQFCFLFLEEKFVNQNQKVTPRADKTGLTNAFFTSLHYDFGMGVINN